MATPPGRGGIGIVRVSGRTLSAFAEGLTGSRPRARSAALCRFLDAEGQVIDRGIVLHFVAPHSYTGEDVLELQGHGSPVIMEQLLRRCLDLGARLAEPGEFTRRAFLNGCLDLAQAEAVADLIAAETAVAARSAMRSLSGEFSQGLAILAEELKALRVRIEAAIDFAEEDIDPEADEVVAAGIRAAQLKVEALLQRGRRGSVLRRGLQVVLAGRPNVGKSSLLNRLAREARAIVTDVPGTTRDALREAIDVGGVPIHVVDTAGLRHTGDEVERLGIGRAWEELRRADAVVLVCDDRDGVGEAEEGILSELPEGVPVILCMNKVDLSGRGSRTEAGMCGTLIGLSARTGEGIELLEGELLRLAGLEGGGEDVILGRERHLAALREAGDHLVAADASIGRHELVAEELRLAQEALGRIVGEYVTDDLLGDIFGRFCIGK